MKTIRGRTGFGDSIYTRAGVEWLLRERFDTYRVYSDYPEVFEDLDVDVVPYSKNIRPDYDFNYLPFKSRKGTNQWRDMCEFAGLDIPLETSLKNRVPSGLVVIAPLHPPMNGSERAIRNMGIDPNAYKKYCSQFGNQVWLKDGKYTFRELAHIVNHASLFVCQVGWGLALAELFDCPARVCFAEKMFSCGDTFHETITPEKVISKSITESVIL